MPHRLLEWYNGVGLPVLEAYGVSENIVPVATNRRDAHKAGTVGKPLPANEVRIAEDGEILVRGAGVALDRNGPQNSFLATGDLGHVDQEGFLTVAGRKEDAFKTSGGKWIAPAEIEGRLHQLPYVAYAIVLGAGRRAPVALIAVAAQDRAGLIGEQIPAAKDCALHDSAAEITLQRNLRDDVAHVLFDLPAYKHPSGLML